MRANEVPAFAEYLLHVGNDNELSSGPSSVGNDTEPSRNMKIDQV